MNRFLVLVLLGMLAAVSPARGASTTPDEYLRRHLATHTEYELRAPLFTSSPVNAPVPSVTTDQTPAPAGYEPVHINLLARHGARWPDANPAAAYDALSELLQEHAGSVKPAWARGWQNRMPGTGMLTDLGMEEHFRLGQRFREAFPSLFGAYSPLNTFTQSTQVPRAGQSAAAFIRGAFPTDAARPYYPAPFVFEQSQSLDTTLRFFTICPRYSAWLSDADGAPSHLAGISNSTQLAGVAARVSAKLGVALTTCQVSSVYDLCAFQLSIYGVSDEWCSLLADEDVTALAYATDMSQWWKKSYGNALNYNISCPLMNVTMSELRDAAVAPFAPVPPAALNQERASLRFAHAETVIPFLALLGLFRDDQPLTVANWDTLQGPQARQFRTSALVPFAANIAMVLYADRSNAKAPRLVKLLVNEQEVAFPACAARHVNGPYCPLQVVLEAYKEASSACNFEAMCKL